jgi:hypothetical protein
MKEGMKYRALFKAGHLNEAGISLYVDALLLEMKEKMPDVILNHVEECMLCKNEIIELHEICKSDPNHKSTEFIFPDYHGKATSKINYSVILKIAAAIILIVSLSFFLRYVIFNNTLKNSDISEKRYINNTLKNEKNKTVFKNITVSTDTMNAKPVIDKKILN